MTTDDHLAREALGRPRAAVAACAAALLSLGGAIGLALTYNGIPEDSTSQLLFIDEHAAGAIASTVALALGALAVAVPLVFLWAATKARKPETPRWNRFLVLFGSVGFAVTQLALITWIVIKAGQFADGDRLYQPVEGTTGPYAEDILEAPFRVSMGLIGQLAQLTLAIGFVVVSLNAMRVGLLTRFLGYLGVITGILFIIPIGSPIPVVQTFWLVALAILLAGRLPSGTPLAWESGRAEPWPSMQEVREQQARERGEQPPPRQRGGGLFGGRAAPAPDPAPADEPGSQPTYTKRKKKKRR